MESILGGNLMLIKKVLLSICLLFLFFSVKIGKADQTKSSNIYVASADVMNIETAKIEQIKIEESKVETAYSGETSNLNNQQKSSNPKELSIDKGRSSKDDEDNKDDDDDEEDDDAK